MSEEMSEDLIRYDILAQEALRGVVRKVLSEVARTGIPGEHHFYISFATRAPGVRISSRLLAQYPEEMTIVLQHQYWDLSVNEQAFEVGLSFNNIPERLLIPFAALKGFADPSVQFGLQFELASVPEGEETSDTGEPKPPVLAPVETAPIAALPKADTDKTSTPESSQTGEPVPAKQAAESDEPGEETESEPVEAEIVSLDAFRKK
jgi:uncharacterized protein